MLRFVNIFDIYRNESYRCVPKKNHNLCIYKVLGRYRDFIHKKLFSGTFFALIFILLSCVQLI